MNAYKCDRCGKLYEKRPANNLLLVNGLFNKSHTADLCPDCYFFLEDWFTAYGAEVSAASDHDYDMKEEKG